MLRLFQLIAIRLRRFVTRQRAADTPQRLLRRHDTRDAIRYFRR